MLKVFVGEATPPEMLCSTSNGFFTNPEVGSEVSDFTFLGDTSAFIVVESAARSFAAGFDDLSAVEGFPSFGFSDLVFDRDLLASLFVSFIIKHIN